MTAVQIAFAFDGAPAGDEPQPFVTEEGRKALADAVERVARGQRHFTSDEVWEAIDATAGAREAIAGLAPVALGPVMRQAAQTGLVRDSLMRRKRSKLAQRHRELIVWESLAYRGGVQ